MTDIRIFEVGGSIRNELLGKPAKDRDFAVIAPDYDTMRQYLIDRGASIYQERPQFVSIRAKLEPLGAVDFTNHSIPMRDTPIAFLLPKPLKKIWQDETLR